MSWKLKKQCKKYYIFKLLLNNLIIILNLTYYNYLRPAIIQALRIMTQLSLPDDNMLIVLARQIATQILPIRIYKIIDPKKVYQTNPILSEAKIAHFKVLEMALKIVGEKSMLTAKAYCNLGKLYLTETNYVVIYILFSTTIISIFLIITETKQ